MAKPGVRRNVFQRILGICATRPPADEGCWRFEEGKIFVDLSRAAELTGGSGAIRLEGKGIPQRVLVFRGTDGRYRALRNRCDHMGRRLDPAPGAERVECCSLGYSVYDYDGNVLSGLAKGKVTAFRVTEGDGRLIIELR
jgi:nitrite reductase/ring-hydroxylating ferredoxin subunit